MKKEFKSTISLFWFRRDLRLKDNRGLSQALQGADPVLPIFIFDPTILNKLENKRDTRVTFIHSALQSIDEILKKNGSGLKVVLNKPENAFVDLFNQFNVKKVYCNHDYEPDAVERDVIVRCLCEKNQIEFLSFKDQCIFEKNEVVKKDKKPYTIFTPYSKAWLSQLKDNDLAEQKLKDNFFRTEKDIFPNLESFGFYASHIQIPKLIFNENLIRQYEKNRNYPALDGTTHLGLHLRFGTVSVRHCVRVAQRLSQVWLKELIWREFFMQILWHFPEVTKSSFRKEYDQIQWRNNLQEFSAWCEGQTGYPLVDAGMRELNKTGYMHNRVRMITASFLTKHLLIDWRWGEKYFASKLLDFDLSANNGNWQWAAGTGCDAAPYFRVFNPELQIKKFDSEYKYINRWVPEYGTAEYPQQIVEHSFARSRALAAYKRGLKK